jgi:hypothetical protein
MTTTNILQFHRNNLIQIVAARLELLRSCSGKRRCGRQHLLHSSLGFARVVHVQSIEAHLHRIGTAHTVQQYGDERRLVYFVASVGRLEELGVSDVATADADDELRDADDGLRRRVQRAIDARLDAEHVAAPRLVVDAQHDVDVVRPHSGVRILRIDRLHRHLFISHVFSTKLFPNANQTV